VIAHHKSGTCHCLVVWVDYVLYKDENENGSDRLIWRNEPVDSYGVNQTSTFTGPTPPPASASRLSHRQAVVFLDGSQVTVSLAANASGTENVQGIGDPRDSLVGPDPIPFHPGI